MAWSAEKQSESLLIFCGVYYVPPKHPSLIQSQWIFWNVWIQQTALHCSFISSLQGPAKATRTEEQRWELSLGQSQGEGICVPITPSLHHYPWNQEQCSKVKVPCFAPKIYWARNQSSKQAHAPQRNPLAVFAAVCSHAAPWLPSEVTEPSWV